MKEISEGKKRRKELKQGKEEEKERTGELTRCYGCVEGVLSDYFGIEISRNTGQRYVTIDSG